MPSTNRGQKINNKQYINIKTEVCFHTEDEEGYRRGSSSSQVLEVGEHFVSASTHG